MIDSRFFTKTFKGSLGDLLNALQGKITAQGLSFGGDLASIQGIATLSSASSSDLGFFDNPKYKDQLTTTQAGAVFLRKDALPFVPEGVIPVISSDPYRDFAHVLAFMYADTVLTEADGVREDGVIIKQGAVVHPSVQIGANTVIGENSVIGAGVCIGRNTIIGANTTITHAYIGDYVSIYTGVRIGQEGFGFALSPKGHLKVPQLGRVIIQDHVEIGANSAVDRGSLTDTVIGEGSKLDNLIQIGHNVVMGRNCVIAGHCAIAGSVKMEDFVVMGGQTCIAGHLTIHTQARISGGSAVMHDVPKGATWGGTPARDIKSVFREYLTLSKLAKTSKKTQQS